MLLFHIICCSTSFFFFEKHSKIFLLGNVNIPERRGINFLCFDIFQFSFLLFSEIFFSLTTSLSLKRIEFHTQSTTFRCDGLECIVSSKNIKILSFIESTLKKFRIVKACDYFKFSFKCLTGSTKLLYCRC